MALEVNVVSIDIQKLINISKDVQLVHSKSINRIFCHDCSRPTRDFPKASVNMYYSGKYSYLWSQSIFSLIHKFMKRALSSKFNSVAIP